MKAAGGCFFVSKRTILKLPFNIPDMLQRIGVAVAPYPKAALFELYERGFTSLFEQLLACVISIRTLDETTIPVSLRLFNKARTPDELLKFSKEQVATLLHGSTFPGQKADTLLAIGRYAMEKGNGVLPADAASLTSIKGVGPKCAHLALGIACGHMAIGVDVHVHRVTNRWGYVETNTPEKTMAALEQQLPDSEWVNINRLLVPFGKHICTRQLPHCSTCPVLQYCRQVGVDKHR
jgi:endonuclease-3